MKKIFLCISLLLFLIGCSQSENRKISDLESWLKDNGKIKVLSTTGMIGDLVSRVGKDRIDQLTLIYGDIDPHTYELVKGDDEKFQFAQVIFSNGLGLEHGASLQRRLQIHSNVISLGSEIQKKSAESILKKDGQVDPHIWLDVSLMKMAVDPIIEALSLQDPSFAEEYQHNGALLKEDLEALDQRIIGIMRKIPDEKRYLVTSHDAFNYFAKRYLGDARCIAPEGLAPEGQLSVADIQEVVRKIQLNGIHVLFPESNVSKDSLKKIAYVCKEKGIDVRISSDPLYADAMGPRTYLEMMQYNAEVICGALDE